MDYKDTRESKILSELIAQLVDEETNSNDLAFLVGRAEKIGYGVEEIWG